MGGVVCGDWGRRWTWTWTQQRGSTGVGSGAGAGTGGEERDGGVASEGGRGKGEANEEPHTRRLRSFHALQWSHLVAKRNMQRNETVPHTVRSLTEGWGPRVPRWATSTERFNVQQTFFNHDHGRLHNSNCIEPIPIASTLSIPVRDPFSPYRLTWQSP